MALLNTSPHIRTLQYWWLGFALLLASGWGAARMKCYDYTGSLPGALAFPSAVAHTVRHELMDYVLLLVVTCTARKAVWWVAIGLLGYKAAYLLLHSYVAPNQYYHEGLQQSCALLHLELVGRVLFGEGARLLTLPALYVYWLWLCVRILRTPDSLSTLRNGNACVA
jgi:hypothetical protein